MILLHLIIIIIARVSSWFILQKQQAHQVSATTPPDRSSCLLHLSESGQLTTAPRGFSFSIWNSQQSAASEAPAATDDDCRQCLLKLTFTVVLCCR
jgi:hypothetical protein